jgi:tetratricopeptide (TPR) repeat protein
MPASNSESAPGKTSFEAGVAAYEAGNLAAAKEHVFAALRADPGNVDARRFAGGLAFSTGDLGEALAHFEEACRLDPDSPFVHFDSAVTYLRLNELDAAQRRCETALALDPSLEPAHTVLAGLRLRGPSYLEVLSWIHARVRPRTYVEIGVETGQSIALAHPETRAIGVDPAPQISVPIGPRTRVVAEKSDDYFARHDVRAELDGLPVDLAFIDGMHHFEFALRDFVNLERLATAQSTILIHDCYPLNRLTAERERQSTFWSGDIWRLVLVLRKHRPDLSVNVIAAAPTGLCIVRRLDPSSRVLAERHDAIVREALALDYSVLDSDQAGMLALFPNDWKKIESLLQ